MEHYADDVELLLQRIEEGSTREEVEAVLATTKLKKKAKEEQLMEENEEELEEEVDNETRRAIDKQVRSC